MQLDKLKPSNNYLIVENPNHRLLELGMTEGQVVFLERIFNNWTYVFIVRGVKLGIRKTELKKIKWGHPK